MGEIPIGCGLDVKSERDRDTRLVVATGEIDLSTVGLLARQLQDLRGVRAQVVDLTGVTFIDASGMRTLLEATARASAHGIDLAIFAPFPPVDRVLELTGVADELPLIALRRP